jgi:hypothetical protein
MKWLEVMQLRLGEGNPRLFGEFLLSISGSNQRGAGGEMKPTAMPF